MNNQYVRFSKLLATIAAIIIAMAPGVNAQQNSGPGSRMVLIAENNYYEEHINGLRNGWMENQIDRLDEQQRKDRQWERDRDREQLDEQERRDRQDAEDTDREIVQPYLMQKAESDDDRMWERIQRMDLLEDYEKMRNPKMSHDELLPLVLRKFDEIDEQNPGMSESARTQSALRYIHQMNAKNAGHRRVGAKQVAGKVSKLTAKAPTKPLPTTAKPRFKSK